jgi:signal transduction histidine kinase
MDPVFLTRLHQLLAGQAADESLPIVEPLLGELWSRRAETPSRELRFAAAESVGARLHYEGHAPSDAVAHLLSVGRATAELAESDHLLDAAGARSFRALVDEAVVQTVAAVERERQLRQQQWLSFLSHELKNPLNTILNALWLLRERSNPERPASGRVLELAQRAVERMEARISDLRALDQRLRAAPPGWEALHGQGRPQAGEPSR